jgi:hypothetical protein
MSTKRWRILAWALGAAVIATGVRAASVADDPYAPLKLYDGKWEVHASDEASVTHLENHCVKTGLFFACEQVVNGKTVALVVFLPIAKTATGGEEYRTQPLRPDASAGGDWGKLTIEDDRWVYSWEGTDQGKKVFWRNVNTFSGKDRIHFEVQNSSDGTTWKTQKSGDESRGT